MCLTAFEHLDAQVPVLDGAGDNAAGLAGDEPGQRPAELAALQPEQVPVHQRDAVAAAAFAAVAADPGGQLVQLPAGGPGSRGLVRAAAGGPGAGSVAQLREQQVCSGGLESLERPDGLGDRLANHPGGGRPGRVALALERQAGDLPPVGPAVGVAADGQAAPAQVLDYWWKTLIPGVRNSSPEMRI